MKFAIKLTLQFVLLLSFQLGLTWVLFDLNTTSAIQAVVMSTVFTYGLGILLPRFLQRKVKAVTIKVDPNELIVKEVAATLLMNGRGILGKLVLTDRRLIFQSVDRYFESQQSIPFSEIQKANTKKTLGFMNDRLILHSTSNAIATFVFEEATTWLQALQEARSVASNSRTSLK